MHAEQEVEMLMEAKIVFRLGVVEQVSATKNRLEITLAGLMWTNLLGAVRQKADRVGYLGLAGVASLPDEEADMAAVRAAVSDRFTSVLSHFLSQSELDYDTVTGVTKHGPYRLGLILGEKRALVQDRVKKDIKLLKQNVQERLEEEASDPSLAARVARQDADASILFQGLSDNYTQRGAELSRINNEYRAQLAMHVATGLNAQLRKRLPEVQTSDHEAKKSLASWVRSELEKFGLAVRHPEQGYPCYLVTLPGHDEKGVFTLEGRKNRKRSHTTADLSSILDFELRDAED